MGVSLLIVTDNPVNHKPGKLVQDLVTAAFNLEARFIMNDYRNYSNDDPAEWLAVEVNMQKKYDREDERDIRISVYSNYYIAWHNDLLSYLLYDKKFYTLAQVHDTKNTRLLFELACEYLALNPSHFLSLEDKWLFGKPEIEKLKKQPFNPDWCFKKPE